MSPTTGNDMIVIIHAIDLIGFRFSSISTMMVIATAYIYRALNSQYVISANTIENYKCEMRNENLSEEYVRTFF